MHYDGLSPEAQARFPLHGWIKGCTGVRHLRLPVLRLYQPSQPAYKRFTENNLAGTWIQFRSPYRTLRQLAIALRDLHQGTRETLSIIQQNWNEREPSEERNNALTQQNEGAERIEILLIGAFVLLRRLADELIDSSRPFLFEHWQSAPEQMKNAIKKSADGTLATLNPICNLDLLNDALRNHTDWLSRLRQENGIRDILVHKPHLLQIAPQSTKGPHDSDFMWEVSAQLITGKSNDLHMVDLFRELVDCIDGACRFMERLYRCAVPLDCYQKNDVLFLTGLDNDVVGFWPPIQAVRTEFPLTA